jgi:cytochrome c553
MHNSENGQLVDPNSPNGNDWLLKDETPSDVCLSCHSTSSSRGVFAADPLAPGNEHGGGNFTFLLEDNINDGYMGGSYPIVGSYAGHSIDAPSQGVGPDANVLTAPGGTFVSANLGCSSCHDPHGNESFRLLHGVGSIQDGIYTFTSPAPDAIGIALGSTAVEANDNHTAYRGGMADWCANCHGDFHSGNTSNMVHEVDENLGGTTASNYNAYHGTGVTTPPATPYLAAVPYESAAMTVDFTGSATGSDQVTCITCHRAHATSAPNAGRWDFNVGFLTEDGHNSGSYAIPNPYAATAGDDQRSLCNKCHVKDDDDGPFVP